MTLFKVLGNVVTDVVAYEKFSFPEQAIGVTHNSSLKGSVAFPGGDGIIGFSNINDSAINATPWFYNLCQKKAFSECRFGLAYGKPVSRSE